MSGLREGTPAFATAVDRHIEREHDPEETERICTRPGRYGCGECEGCESWLDQAVGALEDAGGHWEPPGDVWGDLR